MKATGPKTRSEFRCWLKAKIAFLRNDPTTPDRTDQAVPAIREAEEIAIDLVLPEIARHCDKATEPLTLSAARIILCECLAMLIRGSASNVTNCPDRPLTVKQAADRLNVSAETVYGLVARGELNHHRIGRGRSIRFKPADIQEYQQRMSEAARRPLTHQNPHRL